MVVSTGVALEEVTVCLGFRAMCMVEFLKKKIEKA